MIFVLKIGKFQKRNLRIRQLVSGFTLIELMVTVAIAAILAVIAVPSMNDLFRGARLSTQTDLLIGSLQLARLEAIKRRATVSVCTASSPGSATACAPISTAAEIALAKSYWSKGWLVVGPDGVISRVEINTAVTIDSVTVPMKVDFSGTLGSSSVAGVFKLCTSGQFLQQIDLRLSGSVGKFVDTSSKCT